MPKAEGPRMADGSMTMTQSTQQSAGVWLDHEQAILITHDTELGDFAIGEKLKSGHSRGGGGSEHAINHALRTEDQKFFKSLATHLHPFDEILLFGPGKIQEQFHNHLSEDTQFKNKQITLQSAEHMTDPQMVAQVRNFFNKS